MAKIDDLIKSAEEVQNATVPRSVTAKKIGGMFKDVAEILKLEKEDGLVLNKLTDLLYEVKFTALDYIFARDYFKTHFVPLKGGCTFIRNNNECGRNFDWFYNNEVEFIVETEAAFGRHASKGFAASMSELTKESVALGVSGEMAKILPFRMTDGINDAGVFACINVVNANGAMAIDDKGTNPEIELRDEVNIAMLVRYILDNFDSANKAAQYIKNYVRVLPAFTKDGKYDAQIIVADRTSQMCINFIGTKINWCYYSAVTNFRLYNTIQILGLFDIDKSFIEDYGQGVERINSALDGVRAGNSLRWVLDSVSYTHAYDNHSGWLTEFAGINGATIHDNAALSELHLVAQEKFKQKSRDKGEIWHTTHSVVYDLDKLSAEYKTQEIDDGNSTSGNFSLAENVDANNFDDFFMKFYDTLYVEVSDPKRFSNTVVFNRVWEKMQNNTATPFRICARYASGNCYYYYPTCVKNSYVSLHSKAGTCELHFSADGTFTISGTAPW